MGAWSDPERWASLVSGEACPICVRGKPLDIIAEMESSWITMVETAPLRGYLCLVCKIHAVELHDLPEATSLSFIRDARCVSSALARATGAVKLNYEIHGNSLPHLHLHFFPRYPDDPFQGRPINPKMVTVPVYGPGEFVRLRASFLACLSEHR